MHFGAPLAAMALAVLLSGCLFGNSPEKLNKKIESGDAAKALTVIEDKLASSPEDPALNLLAIKARLALCQQRNCMAETPSATPPLLAGLAKLAANAEGPVKLSEKTPPLTLRQVFTDAMRQAQTLQPQPATALTLYNAVPPAYQPAVAFGLFQPALGHARKAEVIPTATALTLLGKAESLPPTYTYAAGALSGMFTGQKDQRDTNLIALRSAPQPWPSTAAALLPWAILHQQVSVSNSLPTDILAALPKHIEDLKIPALLTSATTAAMADELLASAANPALRQRWAKGWSGTPEDLQLAIQRAALTLDPNRADVWSTYLPALVSATLLQSPSATQPAIASQPLPASRITSASAAPIAAQVIAAAGKLGNYPAVATPLAMFASQVPLTKQQQMDLEKLSQSLLIKAAERGDVTSTVALARTLPGVAQNNRQSVVPLLVGFIRSNLRQGNFEAATNTANLLTQTLQMDVEFEPLIIEEFEADLRTRKIAEQLKADTPDALLLPAEDATLDLGPLFSFMQVHFATQPKVISSQLTTLIAESTGTYGQPTAMYRLGTYFPAETLPPEKQSEWLGASLEQALLADTTLSGPQLAALAAKLAPMHPELNLAPVLETAIRRTPDLEEQRTLWQQATPQVKDILRAIRPEFTLLMQGIDSMAASRLNAAAQAFSGLTDPTWRTEASPFIEQFNERLLTLSGIYVPVSGAPSLKTAALVIEPHGLSGGKLNMVSITFISRAGTMTEAETSTLRTNAMAVKRFVLPVSYNFDTRTLPVTPQAVAQAPQGGTFNATFGAVRNIEVQDGQSSDGTTDTTLLTVTLADGSKTPFVRTLLDTSQPLRPDGIYLLQNRVGTPASATMAILPPGSMLTLVTDAAVMPKPADADATSAYVVPLSGSLRHPASTQPISFTGYYEPDFLTATFTFNYPLPKSAQPARAAVRCQALAGPLTCGTHNLNAARQAYAALTTGLQTRESLATSAAMRSGTNSVAGSRLLLNAVPVIPVAVVATPTIVSATQATSLTALVSATAPVSATSPVSQTTAPAATQPAAATPPALLPAPNLSEAEEEDLLDEQLTPDTSPPTTVPTPATVPSATGPAPGAFINNSGSKSSSTIRPEDTAAPGTFINRSGGKPAATSPTTP